MSSFIVCTGNRSKALLPGSVPNLELNDRITHFDGSPLNKKVLESKVNPNGGQIALLEGVIGKPSKDGRFSYRASPHDNNFEEIVVLFDHLLFLLACLDFVFIIFGEI